MSNMHNPDTEKKIQNLLKNKVVLVTGGSGSIGSEIVHRLLQYDVKTVRVFDNSEGELFRLSHSIKDEDKPRVRIILGDVKDIDRVKKVMKGVNIVFHAAALKHVAISEYNPFEAVKTNIMGTQNLIDASQETGIERFVMISTDKAASPLNVMGATKLLGEKIVTAAEKWKGPFYLTSKYCSVRFGNVFGSKGSVYPIIRNQILLNKKVTLTNPNMTRFLMKIPESIDLILYAMVETQGGEIFIPKMKTIKIEDLVNNIVNYVSSKFNPKYSSENIIKVNARAGEKMHELLVTKDEGEFTYEYGDYYILIPNVIDEGVKYWMEKGATRVNKEISSHNAEFLTKDEIIDFMDDAEESGRIVL